MFSTPIVRLTSTRWDVARIVRIMTCERTITAAWTGWIPWDALWALGVILLELAWFCFTTRYLLKRMSSV